MNGTMRWLMGALVGRLVPALELFAQVAQESSGERTVDEPVVVREREVHDRPDRDHVLALLVLDDPRPLYDRVRPENRRLRLADHRRPVERPVAAGVRDREGPALDVVREQLLVPRPLGDVDDAPCEAEQVQALRVLDDRDDQALAVLELDGEAEVDIVARYDLVAADLTVDPGVVAQRLGSRARDEREVREVD